MKLAIMQPYVFPYIGYFQLINAVDLFVFYNDVNFIKKGWINRNRILVNGKDLLFTIPCEDISQHKLICDTKIGFNNKERSRLLTTIQQGYKKAPFFNETFEIVEKVLSGSYTYIDEMAMAGVKEVCRYLNIRTKFKESHGQYDNRELVHADRIIDICRQENAGQYINAEGGTELYSKDQFDSSGIKLSFLKPGLVQYRQFDNEFVPSLSIIDVLMFNSKDDVKQMLHSFELV
jgi:WbqC-like protein family